MYSLNLLTVFLSLSLLLARQGNALNVQITSVSCDLTQFTVTLNSVDYAAASFATFVAIDASNTNDFSSASLTVLQNGQIQEPNVPYSFNFDITPGQEPGGSQWIMGMGLDDAYGNPLDYEGSAVGLIIENPCLNPSYTYAPTISFQTTAAFSTPASQSTAFSSSTISSFSTPIRSSSSMSSSSSPSTPYPTPYNNSTPTVHHNTAAYVGGGIAGALALLIAVGIFICVRNRKTSQYGSGNDQSRSVNTLEKGYVSNDPIHSVNELPRNGNSNLSDFISKENSGSDRTSSVPPMSPRTSQWNATAPMSPALSATSAPSRANNPLFNHGSEGTGNSNNGWHQTDVLPEPMSR